MRKFFLMILLTFLLSGCGAGEMPTATEPETSAPVQTQPVAIPETTEAPMETESETPELPALITDCTMVRGTDFVRDPALAEALDDIFAGDFGLCSDGGCSNPLNAALGTSAVPQNGSPLHWRYIQNDQRAMASGTSCWAYACCAYGRLYENVHPQVTRSENHAIRREPNERFCYESFRLWEVRDDVPVYVRTFNHSIIVLGYDENEITYVDGNGDRKGFIAIRREPWQSTTGGIDFYGQDVALVVQPTFEYVASQK